MKQFAILVCLICCAFSLKTGNYSVPTTEIAPGVLMPMVGLGTWEYNDTVVYTEVSLGLGIGYRAIDTAHDYANAKGIQKAINDSGIPREQLWITTKIEGGLDYNTTIQHFKDQLTDLQTGYIDLLLIHFPCTDQWQPFNPAGRKIQWQALESLYDQNLTRAIGVSHYCKSHLTELLSYARIKPALNQVQYHVGMGSAGPNATDDKEFCQSQNITYAPFSELCGPCCQGKPSTCTANKELISGEMVTSIGKKYNKSGAQVSLRWCVQQGLPIIPKSHKLAYLQEDIDIFDFTLSDADMATLTKSPTPAIAGPDGTSGDCAFP